MRQLLVIMLARVLAVEMLCCVMTFAFVLPPLRRRLQHLRDATLRAAPRCCACLGCLLGGRRWRDAADDAGLAQQARPLSALLCACAALLCAPLSLSRSPAHAHT